MAGGGNTGALSAFMAAMPDSFMAPRSASLGGAAALLRDPYAEELYKSQLKQWLADNEASLYGQESARLGSLWEQLGPALMQSPNLSDDSKRALMLAAGGGGLGMRTREGFQAEMELLKNSQGAFADGGKPSDDMKEYFLAQQDPNFQPYQIATNGSKLPAALQIAQELARSRGLTQPGEKEITDAAKIQSPEQAYAISQAGAQGKADVELDTGGPIARSQSGGSKEGQIMVEQIANAPKTVESYRSMIEGIDRMQGLSNQLLDFTNREPNATGVFTTWLNEKLPGMPSAAKEWANLRDTLRSNLTLEKLGELKMQSATGATGLGATSETEFKTIQQAMTNLEQSTSARQLRENLKALNDQLVKVRERAFRDWGSDYQWYMKNRGFAPNLARDIAAPPEEQAQPNDGAVPPSSGWKVRRVR